MAGEAGIVASSSVDTSGGYWLLQRRRDCGASLRDTLSACWQRDPETGDSGNRPDALAS